MALNNVRPVGDDQEWKAEVERQMKELVEAVRILKTQVASR